MENIKSVCEKIVKCYHFIRTCSKDCKKCEYSYTNGDVVRVAIDVLTLIDNDKITDYSNSCMTCKNLVLNACCFVDGADIDRDNIHGCEDCHYYKRNTDEEN